MGAVGEQGVLGNGDSGAVGTEDRGAVDAISFHSILIRFFISFYFDARSVS